MANNKSNKPQRKDYFTPEGIAKFAFLNKPQTEFNADGVFQVCLLLPIDSPKVADLIAVYDAEEAAAKETTFAEIDKIDKPKKVNGQMLKPADAREQLKKTLEVCRPYEVDYDKEGNETGYMLFRFKMKAKRIDRETGSAVDVRPAVCDAHKRPIDLDEVMIGGNSKVKVKFRIAPNYQADSNKLYLTNYFNAVQVIELVSFGGDSFGGFDEEEGYAYTQNNSNPATEGFVNEGDDANGDY